MNNLLITLAMLGAAMTNVKIVRYGFVVNTPPSSQDVILSAPQFIWR